MGGVGVGEERVGFVGAVTPSSPTKPSLGFGRWLLPPPKNVRVEKTQKSFFLKKNAQHKTIKVTTKKLPKTKLQKHAKRRNSIHSKRPESRDPAGHIHYLSFLFFFKKKEAGRVEK